MTVVLDQIQYARHRQTYIDVTPQHFPPENKIHHRERDLNKDHKIKKQRLVRRQSRMAALFGSHLARVRASLDGSRPARCTKSHFPFFTSYKAKSVFLALSFFKFGGLYACHVRWSAKRTDSQHLSLSRTSNQCTWIFSFSFSRFITVNQEFSFSLSSNPNESRETTIA